MTLSFKRIDDFVRAMDGASTLDDIFAVLRAQTEALGFERYAYWLTWSPDGRRVPLYINSFPNEWIKHYVNENFGSDDLVVRYAATRVNPYMWQDVKEQYNPTERQRLVFNLSYEAGLKDGATVPIYGPGKAQAVFSVANSQNDHVFAKLFFETRHTLHLIATYAHEKIIELGLHNEERTSIQLSAREIEVLTWTARGKTRWEISQILSISDETVKTHLEHACKRLNCLNKTHAITIALLNGLIIP